MKKQIPPFLAGVLTALLVLSLGASALAASGRLTLEVDPVRIQVDGQLFQPKDVNGNDVPVFSYNGTTYAPLRALVDAPRIEQRRLVISSRRIRREDDGRLRDLDLRTVFPGGGERETTT